MPTRVQGKIKPLKKKSAGIKYALWHVENKKRTDST